MVGRGVGGVVMVVSTAAAALTEIKTEAGKRFTVSYTPKLKNCISVF